MNLLILVSLLGLVQLQIAHAWAEEILLGDAAEIEASAASIKESIGNGWKIDVRGRDIVIEMDKPIAFANVDINAPAVFSKAEAKAHEAAKTTTMKVCRYTLRFDNKLTKPIYEKLREENRAIEKRREALRAKVRHIGHKFDQYLPQNEVEKQQVEEYRQGLKKLISHDLPDLFSTDHSIRVYRSWSFGEYPHNKEVMMRISRLEQRLQKLFGVYDPMVIQNRTTFGRYHDPTQ